jgi:acyl-coenzyme A thioesterase PaaI-like protein
VTLRLPPPLERPLAAERVDARGALLRDGDAVVAEARAIDDLELELPDPLGVEEAEAARGASPLHREHPFPGCFVCGPERRLGDGLGIVCGPVGAELVAAPWRVDGSLPTEDGAVAPEIVWAALDCPGGLAGILQPSPGVLVLGRLAARVDGPVHPGTTCVAVGWPIDRDGRKFHAGSAIFSGEGELLAHARATWIELKG